MLPVALHYCCIGSVQRWPLTVCSKFLQSPLPFAPVLFNTPGHVCFQYSRISKLDVYRGLRVKKNAIIIVAWFRKSTLFWRRAVVLLMDSTCRWMLLAMKSKLIIYSLLDWSVAYQHSILVGYRMRTITDGRARTTAATSSHLPLMALSSTRSSMPLDPGMTLTLLSGCTAS